MAKKGEFKVWKIKLVIYTKTDGGTVKKSDTVFAVSEKPVDEVVKQVVRMYSQESTQYANIEVKEINAVKI